MTSARRLLVVGGTCVVALTACTTTSDPQETSQDSSTPALCGGKGAETVADEQLTIATYDPVFAPWFVSNEPGNGQGYESALGFRVAKSMGFEPRQVRWVRVPFDEILEPTGSSFDLALAEVSITPERKKSVDFSTPYAATRQVVLTTEDSPIATKKSVNGLRDAKLGAAVQTTSLDAITRVVQPSSKPTSFQTIAAAATALDERKVDGVVVDGPTAEYLASSRLDGGRLLGSLPGTSEQVAAVLPKGSSLTPCVNRALADLDQSGAIKDLEQEWLPSAGSVAELMKQSPSDRKSPRSGTRTAEPTGTPTGETGRTSPSPTK